MQFWVWNKENNCWYKPTYEAHLGRLSELLLTHKWQLIEHTMAWLIHESLFAWKYIIVKATPWIDSRQQLIYNYDIVHIEWGAYPWEYSLLWDNKTGCWWLRQWTAKRDIRVLLENIDKATVIYNLLELGMRGTI